MEQDREGVRDLLRAFDRHRVDETPRLTDVATTTRVTGSPPQTLDVVVEVFATGLRDDLTEQPAEQPHILTQCVEFVSPVSCHEPRA